MDVEAGGGGGGQRSAKVPAYLWDLYERHQRAPETVPDGTIRHYTPSTHDHEDGDEEGTVWMVFNLSATGRVPHRVSDRSITDHCGLIELIPIKFLIGP